MEAQQSESTIQPPPLLDGLFTYQGRLGNLDVLRGFAILGILLANIMAFSEVNIVYMITSGTPFVNDLEFTIEAWRNFLVSGKFRGMLGILFGIGMYIQYSSSVSNDRPWPGIYIRRTLFLGLIGFIHGVFIWHGDILFAYSVVAFMAMFLCRSTDLLRWWMIGIGCFIAFAMGILASVSSSTGAGDMGELARFLSPQFETQVFQAGPYWQQLLFRVGLFGVGLFNVLFLALALLALFLIGFQYAKQGFFKDPYSSPKYLKVGMICFWGGLLVNFLPVFLRLVRIDMHVSDFVDLFLSMPLALGYVVVFTVIYHKTSKSILWRPMQKVGRIALTSYLLQSIVMTTAFYSWGGGYFGKLDQAVVLGAVVAMWVINVAFAYLWLAFFRIGPVEWLWRSATYKQRLPIWRERKSLEQLT